MLLGTARNARETVPSSSTQGAFRGVPNRMSRSVTAGRTSVKRMRRSADALSPAKESTVVAALAAGSASLQCLMGSMCNGVRGVDGGAVEEEDSKRRPRAGGGRRERGQALRSRLSSSPHPAAPTPPPGRQPTPRRCPSYQCIAAVAVMAQVRRSGRHRPHKAPLLRARASGGKPRGDSGAAVLDAAEDMDR
jgi:hypothetical protein